MTLRLSSATTSADDYLKQIADDSSLSLTQKNDCLKTLHVVLKNLIDSSKGGLAGDAGLKYRTLKLDNPKLQARLFCSASVQKLLLEIVGMTPNDNTLTLLEPPAATLSDVIGLKLLPSISTAQQQIAKTMESTTTTTTIANKKAKLTEHNGKPTLAPTEKLSEKQKARLLMEQKAQLEKQREKEFRKQTRAKIAADKLVRQKDENWKPTVSAAAAKTGSGLLTFRDRHGE